MCSSWPAHSRASVRRGKAERAAGLRKSRTGRAIACPAGSSIRYSLRLGELQVGRLGAARIRLDVERHALTFLQAPHAGRFNGCGMDEHVLAAAFGRDEAKAFGGVEK